ncbi:hypothetical protein NITMOv2_4689 [Nitrospira moscoviensis]|uniref:Uncharacterized protein n=1 Tax=Nitrospira moscoviensis TaxID=42253 RepID=A0A0K2G6G5_NITMO|nr:hypothetical protein NITMOv2_0093 [Nitrospira moscoviensis]ALA61060.1 hypothetical protein NITMOv2_4689 [Nitrospira moscoviensis]
MRKILITQLSPDINETLCILVNTFLRVCHIQDKPLQYRENLSANLDNKPNDRTRVGTH